MDEHGPFEDQFSIKGTISTSMIMGGRVYTVSGEGR